MSVGEPHPFNPLSFKERGKLCQNLLLPLPDRLHHIEMGWADKKNYIFLIEPLLDPNIKI
jgi:hypothetical protein